MAAQRTLHEGRPHQREWLRQGGQPLSRAERAFFEPRLAHDFSVLGGHAATLAERVAQRAGIQRKLTISVPADADEQEADRVSERITRTDAVKEEPCACGGTCASCASKHAKRVQLARSSASKHVPAEAPPIVQRSVRTPGRPLDAATRAFFEARLGTDFGDVRVHTDRDAAVAARALRADAFTCGSDVVFASGQYEPHSDTGRRLLGHELVHVVQQRDDVRPRSVQRAPDQAAEEPRIESYVFAGPRTLATDVAFAEQSGAAMAQRVLQRGKLVHDDRIEMNGMLAFFEGEAKEVYTGKIRPALVQVTTEIEMPEFVVRPQAYVFAGDKRLASDVAYARQRGAELAGRIRKLFAVSWDDHLEMEGMKAFFQAEAHEAYLGEIQPALQSLEPTLENFLARFWTQPQIALLPSLPTLQVEQLAEQLATYASTRSAPAAFIRDVFAHLPSDREDEVGAEFISRLEDYTLASLASTAEGRAALNVVYGAIITGDVTDFQRKQSDRILKAQSEHLIIGEGERLLTFPMRNIGWTRYCSATFRASLRPNGRVFVRYTSIKVDQCDMFREDLETLGGWRTVRDGLELDPNEIVTVKVYEGTDTPVPQPVPALALIDFANQIQEATLGTATTAFVTGLTIGFGGLSGAGVRELEYKVAAGEASTASLWGARALLWADRVATFLPVGAMVLNENRGWIIEHFGEVGKKLLDAVDTANSIAGYYGWGRLGFDGLRFIGAKLRPAWQAWRLKTGNMEGADRRLAHGIDVEVESFLNEIDYAAASKVEKPGQAVAYVNEHPNAIEGKPGSRRARVGDEHEVVEVMDASKPSGIGCEFHSPGGPAVDCPIGMGKGPVEPAPAAFGPGQAPTKVAEVMRFLRGAGLEESEILGFAAADASRLGPATAARVGRLAEHFNPGEMKALGNFLFRHEIVINDELAAMLINNVKRGELVEKLSALDVAAVRAQGTAMIVDVEGGVTVQTKVPRRRGEPVPAAPPRPREPYELAEEQLLPALEQQYGPGWRYHPREFPAPGAEPGERLGSTVPEYYHPGFKTAFEVKRFRLDEMGIGPAGEKIGQASQETVDALARARVQLGQRIWAMGEDVTQNIVFNVTGQGVKDVSAVGVRIKEMLETAKVGYKHLWIQNGTTLTSIF